MLHRDAEHHGTPWQERGVSVVLGACEEASSCSDDGRECLRGRGQLSHGSVQHVEHGESDARREPTERHRRLLHRVAV